MRRAAGWLRLALDYAMPALFLYLMAYRPGSGLWRHGVLGSTLLALFVLHHALNWRWHRGLLHGRYAAPRLVFLVLNAALLAAMLALLASALMLFGEVFDLEWLPVAPRAGRRWHTAAAAWCFILAALHLGLHTHALLRRLEKALHTRSRALRACWHGAFAAILAAGAGAFAKSALWAAMLRIPHEAPALPTAALYLQFILIGAAACLVTHLIMQAARHIAGAGKQRNTAQAPQ